jgi:two-component system sensor histidine kinase KdpD
MKEKTVSRHIFQNPSKTTQYLVSVSAVASVVLLGLFLYDVVGYRTTAFMLLVTVSLLAMVFDMAPVLVAATLSALLWDFLFIPPRFTFTVGTTEDQWLLLMYFIIVMIHAVLTFKIRAMQQEIKAREDKANSIKFYNALFNSLSHELRTPITTILGATDNLLSPEEKLTPENRRLLTQEISDASLRLNQQVENLLNMSRLESGIFKIKKDWCDVNELVYTVLNRLESPLKKYKVVVDIPEPFPLFKLDIGLMEQVLHNLINNAIAHTPPDTQITIQAKHEHNVLTLIIADNGHGFPEEDLERVFGKFYRVQGTKAGGTGLGLSIVKGFVEAHQGQIRLENLPVCGARFTIEIPSETSYLNSLKNE